MFADEIHSLLTFSFFAKTPSFFAQPTSFSAQPSTFARSPAAPKEIDILFGLLFLSCYSERNQWQILTEAGSYGLQRCKKLGQRTFQAAARRTGSGWHSPAARQTRVRFPVTDTDAGPKRQTQNENCEFKALAHVGAFTLHFPYKCTPARAGCAHEASTQTLRMRTRANMKQKREKFLIGLSLKVRQNRMCNNHRRRRNVPQIHCDFKLNCNFKLNSSI